MLVAGYAALLVGIHAVSPPAAWGVGGVLLMVAGAVVEVGDGR